LTPKKDPIIIQSDPVEDAQVADIKSERWAASNRNQWPASRWNAWPTSSESAIESIEEAPDYATQWLWTYNNERPNMGIGGITPAQKPKLAA
jgi:transposase InsO family protein